jgi:hypothetical protein
MSPLLSLLSGYTRRLAGGKPSRTDRRRAGGPRKPRRPTLAVELLEERTVLTAVAAPSGLVSWWTANGTANDFMGLNNANPIGLTYAAGEVG